MPPMAPKATCMPEATLAKMLVIFHKEEKVEEQHEHLHSDFLSTNVIRLPRKRRWDVTIGTRQTHEDTKVPHTVVCRVRDDHEACDSDGGL